ncbi:hypothetical protein BH09PSE5_BH09PSE5_27290 [soil metagenome]
MPLTTIEMSCHVWAMAGNPMSAKQTNLDYMGLTDRVAMPYLIGAKKMPGSGAEMAAVRQRLMEQIADICERRTEMMGHTVYLCGGFERKAIAPEHMWLEDHTARCTYDTFINQQVRTVHRVGLPNQPFQPGCEAQPFPFDRIARIRMDGFTRSQALSIGGHHGKALRKRDILLRLLHIKP